jgi:hypothetical protein
VEKTYGKPPAMSRRRAGSKINAEIACDNRVPTKVARLWRSLVEKGLL